MISFANRTLVLSSDFNVGSFHCGVPELDVFIQKYAMQSQASHASRTYVFFQESTIAGYFTLTYGSVSPEKTPSRVSAGIGRYPIPVMVLARLAVDKRYQGIGIGESLLKDSFNRTINASKIAGLRAMFVVAKNERAREFYKKYEFVESGVDEFHLYHLLKDILRSV